MAENNHPGDAGSENPKVVDDKSVGGNAAAADNILAGVDCGAGDIGDNPDFVQLDVDQHLEEAFAHFDGLPFLTCKVAQETAGRTEFCFPNKKLAPISTILETKLAII